MSANQTAVAEAPRPMHVAPSPHIAASEGVSQIMLWVIGALLPAALYSVYLMGATAAGLLATCIIVCLATEYVWNLAVRRPQTLMDGSALVTGLLLALSLPPKTPLWIAGAAGIVAIALAKQLFGGLGWNLFNPALVGRAVALLSWAGVMSEIRPIAGGWYAGLEAVGTDKYDTITGATRLAIAAADRAAGGAYNFDPAAHYGALLFRNTQGSLGEVSAALLILGGLVLIAKGIIDWRIPVGYIGTVALGSWLFGADPVFNVLAGGVLLGAFFMATDYVTSPMTRGGRIIFGIGCGLFNVVTRFFGPMPESTTFAILFMNGLAPLMDRPFAPVTFGRVKSRG